MVEYKDDILQDDALTERGYSYYSSFLVISFFRYYSSFLIISFFSFNGEDLCRMKLAVDLFPPQNNYSSGPITHRFHIIR